jgi:hypothetical protein
MGCYQKGNANMQKIFMQRIFMQEGVEHHKSMHAAHI